MPGTLSIMERPRAGSVLEDLIHVQKQGVDTILSMLQQDEAQGLGLGNEPDLCNALGMRYMSRPIEDMQLPIATEFQRCIDGVAQILFHGGHIAIHCRAGIGRSGMVAATVLGLFDHTAAQAIERVSQARGTRVPDTAEQAAFIATMIERMR